MMLINARSIGSTRMCVALAACLALVATANASTKDRAYLFGDDPGEGATVGSPSNQVINSNPVAFLANTNLGSNNGPLYTDASGRPGATAGTKALSFNGTNQYSTVLSGSLGSPATGDDQYAGTPNYAGITTRLMDGWVKPTNNAATTRQDIVFDSAEFGVFVNASNAATNANNWGWAYDGTSTGTVSTIRTTTTPVVFNQWHHVMHRTIGQGTGILYVDGVAIDAVASNYTGTPSAGPNLNLTFGANFNNTANFFAGEVDDWNFYVSGNNSTTAGGANYGAVNLAVENDFIRQAVAGKKLGDVDLSGVVDNADIAILQSNWLKRRLVNNIQVGDMTSRGQGDLDFDGDIDLSDAYILRVSLGGGPGSGSSVPEPGSMVLALLGLVAFVTSRRCRR